MVGSSPPGVAIISPRKLLNFDPNCRWQGAKFASVTNFLKNVTNFCSLAVLRGSFVELYNLVHSLTGLTPLVHFCGVEINHLVGAVSGDGLNLTVGAASFQEVDGCVLTKPVERVVLVDAAQTKTATLWLPILLQSSLTSAADLHVCFGPSISQ